MIRSLLLVPALLCAAAAAADAQDKIKVLIVDGQNNHNYKAMTPFMKEQLEKSGLFTVDVSTTPPAAPDELQAASPSTRAIATTLFRSMFSSCIRDVNLRNTPRGIWLLKSSSRPGVA